MSGLYGYWPGRRASQFSESQRRASSVRASFHPPPCAEDRPSELESRLELLQSQLNRCVDRAKCDQKKGAPGFEPGTSWSAVKCSTTELYPLLKVFLLGVCILCCHSLTNVYFGVPPSFPAVFAYQLPAGHVHTGVTVSYICMRDMKERDDKRRTKIGKGQRSEWKCRKNSTLWSEPCMCLLWFARLLMFASDRDPVERAREKPSGHFWKSRWETP